MIEIIDNQKYIEIWVQDKKLKELDKKLYLKHLGKIRACTREEELRLLLSNLEEKITLGLVYKFLALKGYMVHELRKKLEEKKIGKEAIDAVLKKCEEAGYLNDEREASLFVQREKRRGQGPLSIKNSLREKTGGSALSERIISEQFSEEEQRSQIESILNKRFSNLSDLKDKQRAFRFLLRRGFSSELIREIILE